MIRRGFWLMVGAVGGIVGYRRVVALLPRGGDPPGSPRARGGSPPPRSPLAPRARGAARPPYPRAPRRRWVRETIRFTRDVREGMDLYMVRHPRRVGPTLDADIDENVKDDR
jgi:hypothetical protein